MIAVGQDYWRSDESCVRDGFILIGRCATRIEIVHRKLSFVYCFICEVGFGVGSILGQVTVLQIDGCFLLVISVFVRLGTYCRGWYCSRGLQAFPMPLLLWLGDLVLRVGACAVCRVGMLLVLLSSGGYQHFAVLRLLDW